MKLYRRRTFVPCIFLVLILSLSLSSQSLANEKPFDTAEGVVQKLYDLVTFDAGSTPDWDEVKSLFIDKAIVVLRTGRDNSTVFTLQGFVDDFVNFIEKAKVVETGFKEEIKRIKPMVFGDIATVLVLYEASIPGRKRPPQQGVDSFSLIKKDGRWQIVSIINEIPTPSNPLPEELQ
ncbi:nuclear transport factor 2 family protein [Acidobacteriota bacterium]